MNNRDGGKKIRVVTFAETLMRYAKELGEARKSGDEDRIRKAKDRHDAYVKVVLRSDRMVVGRISDLL